MIVKGDVTRKLFSPGSKSEHVAVVLRADGAEYVLRRVGANPFTDPTMDALVGKRVEIDGDLRGYNLMVRSWHELEPS